MLATNGNIIDAGDVLIIGAGWPVFYRAETGRASDYCHGSRKTH